MNGLIVVIPSNPVNPRGVKILNTTPSILKFWKQRAKDRMKWFSKPVMQSTPEMIKNGMPEFWVPRKGGKTLNRGRNAQKRLRDGAARIINAGGTMMQVEREYRDDILAIVRANPPKEQKGVVENVTTGVSALVSNILRGLKA